MCWRCVGGVLSFVRRTTLYIMSECFELMFFSLSLFSGTIAPMMPESPSACNFTHYS
jgi:hypothetical protein